MNEDTLELEAGHMTIPYQRRDTQQKDIVDLGIALQQRSNTMSAVEYMRSQNVGNDVIERVLVVLALGAGVGAAVAGGAVLRRLAAQEAHAGGPV